MEMKDILYGKITLPDWLVPFIFIPEFVRLRGVRLSNVDSVEFKDFNGPSRWEHCIGAAFLALKYSELKNLPLVDKVHLTIAALLHDIGTPPFAHTIEYVLDGFDHEEESSRLVANSENWDHSIFEGALPQFHKQCAELKIQKGINVNSDVIAQYINGDGEYGFLINGSIDIDNIDNLLRASIYLGYDVEKNLGINLIKWLVGFKSVPTDIKNCDNPSVQKWLHHRNELYSSFFNSSDVELGRQAFLQHLIRRAFNEGLTKKTIIYSTDELLLYTIENFISESNSGKKNQNTLKSLVSSYRLLESTHKYATIPIENEQVLRVLLNPLFANWLETELSTSTFEPFVIINQRRYDENSQLFKNNPGEICIFKLRDNNLKFEQLPKWIQKKLQHSKTQSRLNIDFKKLISECLNEWVETKPWHVLSIARKDNLISNLEHEKDWSFKHSQNKNIHTYPATFVNAIPKNLISALGIKGELIIDPFCGTGQTAVEAIKAGCSAVTSDINSIAVLATKAKTTYLSISQRNDLRSISNDLLKTQRKSSEVDYDIFKKWHHQSTFIELSKIKGFIEQITDIESKQFLFTCFSEILTSCTDRKGKGTSYFADNTPLPKGKHTPDYQNAIELFISKLQKNIDVIELMYSQIERNRKDPQEELSKVRVIQTDVRNISPDLYEIDSRAAAAVITSPPYLCMVDYSLGQRLSYYWLFHDMMEKEYKLEIGARRSRNQIENVLTNYFSDIRSFIQNMKLLLRKDGYMACVIGEPVAESFKNKLILSQIDKIFNEEGFELIWQKERPINWHRNHGITSLESERISVHILRE